MGKTLTFSPKYAPDLYTEIPRDPIQEQLTIDRFNDGVPDSRRGRPPVGDPSSPQHFLHRRAPEQGCPAVSQWRRTRGVGEAMCRDHEGWLLHHRHRRWNRNCFLNYF